ncbi:MAG: hypothetical protein IT393_12305 [Nitrospirae bacterium]|nr:hypothetical protein [Nitrospirota bacterium]
MKRFNAGAVMLITLLFLLLLTILGTSSLYLAYTEMILSRGMESDAKAFYIAESGIERTLYLFANPDNFGGTPGDSFKKRLLDNTSFFDAGGVSQYSGTAGNPDITLSGTDNELRIYKPVIPGALCTVKSTGISGRISRIVTAELIEGPSGTEVLPGSWRSE